MKELIFLRYISGERDAGSSALSVVSVNPTSALRSFLRGSVGDRALFTRKTTKGQPAE